MNKKKLVINNFHKVCDVHKDWLDQAQRLMDGESTHSIRKPILSKDCDLGIWINSEEQILSTFSWFKDVKTLHQTFHDAYKVIYDEAQHTYDSEALSDLKGVFANLQDYSDSLNNIVENIKESLRNADDDKFEATDDSSTEEAKSIEEPIKIEAGLAPAQLEIRKLLKQQDLKQLHQELQLAELEFKQLEDRTKLTIQGAEQISQYQELKRQEIEQQLNQHQKLENENIKAKESRRSELTSIQQQIVLKQDELEQLSLVDKKLEQRRKEEEKKEQKIINDFKQDQFATKQDLIQLEQQRQQWQSELERLTQQQQLIEQDMENLVQRLLEKQVIIDQSNQEKDKKLFELKEHVKQQETLNGHKAKVRESKQEELMLLEQEKASKQQELQQLDIESSTLATQKLEVGKQQKSEVKHLGEQHQLKTISIDKLGQDKQLKQQELKELNLQETLIQKELEQLSQKNKTAETA